MSTDQAVNVNVITFPKGDDWWLTPDGEAALDAAELRSREIAQQARQLAIQRRNQQVAGDPPSLI